MTLSNSNSREADVIVRDEIFISYSHKDRKWFERLQVHLKPRIRQGKLAVWEDTQLRAGDDWLQEIQDALKRAKVAVLLVTPDYLASDFISEQELPELLTCQTGLTVIWIPIRPSGYKETKIARYQAGCTPNKPLSLLSKVNAEFALEEICELIVTAFHAGKYLASQKDIYRHLVSTQSEHLGQMESIGALASLPQQPYFFGRVRELASIAEAIAPEARTWGVLIDGPGGIGKTALAVRAGYLAPSEHFPLKIFLSAKVRDLTPAGERSLEDLRLSSFQDLLKALAAEMSLDILDDQNSNELASMVHHALLGKKSLLIIDNVETLSETDRAKLYQFLSRLPIRCKAIVTSRRRHDIDARIIRLDRLLLDEALALLNELAKRNRYLAKATDQERHDLYEASHGNPLLIKWLVGQLGRPGSHCRTVKDACAFLSAISPENDPLEYIFGDLLGTFTESETAVLAALSHFTTPAKVEWLAILAGLSYHAALTSLEDLDDRALLVSDESRQTFFLPSHASTFLRTKCPDIVTVAGNRLTNRVLALALENGHDNYARFNILEAEWPALSSALPLFIQGDNTYLQVICNALFKFMFFTGRWDDWIAFEKESEEKALAEGDFYNAGWRAHNIGWIYLFREQAQQVMACAYRCEAYWQKGRSGALEKLSVARLKGFSHKINKNYLAAQIEHNNAFNLGRTHIPNMDISFILFDLSEIEYLLGNLDSAENSYRQVLDMSKKTNFQEIIADTLGRLAEVANARRDWTSAEAMARESLALSESLGRQQLIGINCLRLAEALAAQGKNTEGMPYARHSVELSFKLRQPEQLKRAQAVLAACEG